MIIDGGLKVRCIKLGRPTDHQSVQSTAGKASYNKAAL